ncbi:MAG: nitrate reductase cytochrome c-type subunit [Thiobacillus sp.]
MKTTMMIMLVAAAVTITGGALQAGEVSLLDDQMGLSKTSVFDDPSPEVFSYPQTEPSAATGLPRAWDSAPPQVPHKIEAFLPIKVGKNLCITCHDRPMMQGRPKAKGIASPMPESHYYKAENGRLTRSDSRYICVQCHTPQADVKELVGNTFAQ